MNYFDGTTANTADSGGEGLTVGKLLAMMQELNAAYRAPPPMRMVESWHAVQQGGRVKRYPKRRAKSERHWRRMEKKWTKRYGFKQEPCAYRMDGSALGMPYDMLVVHPTLAPQYRSALRRSGDA
jgi:hypothetical protein